MAQSVLEMAKDLTTALIQAGQLQPEDMQDVLQQTYANLSAMKAQEMMASTHPTEASPEPIDWRKSITRHAITCLVCGQTFKQLSIRHLRQHDLDGRSYRLKYGIPRTQPLAARATTARRQQVAQDIRPWEKTPRYMEAQKAKAAAAKKTAGRKKAAGTET
jgi:predicted transcriptional regulator